MFKIEFSYSTWEDDSSKNRLGLRMNACTHTLTRTHTSLSDLTSSLWTVCRVTYIPVSFKDTLCKRLSPPPHTQVHHLTDFEHSLPILRETFSLLSLSSPGHHSLSRFTNRKCMVQCRLSFPFPVAHRAKPITFAKALTYQLVLDTYKNQNYKLYQWCYSFGIVNTSLDQQTLMWTACSTNDINYSSAGLHATDHTLIIPFKLLKWRSLNCQ